MAYVTHQDFLDKEGLTDSIINTSTFETYRSSAKDKILRHGFMQTKFEHAIDDNDSNDVIDLPEHITDKDFDENVDSGDIEVRYQDSEGRWQTFGTSPIQTVDAFNSTVEVDGAQWDSAGAHNNQALFIYYRAKKDYNQLSDEGILSSMIRKGIVAKLIANNRKNIHADGTGSYTIGNVTIDPDEQTREMLEGSAKDSFKKLLKQKLRPIVISGSYMGAEAERERRLSRPRRTRDGRITR